MNINNNGTISIAIAIQRRQRYGNNNGSTHINVIGNEDSNGTISIVVNVIVIVQLHNHVKFNKIHMIGRIHNIIFID